LAGYCRADVVAQLGHAAQRIGDAGDVARRIELVARDVAAPVGDHLDAVGFVVGLRGRAALGVGAGGQAPVLVELQPGNRRAAVGQAGLGDLNGCRSATWPWLACRGVSG